MFDFVSYMLGKKSAGGGLLPGITKLESGEFSENHVMTHMLNHSLGSAKHSIIIFRESSGGTYALAQAKFYNATTDTTVNINIAADGTVTTTERLHSIPNMVICESPPNSAYEGKYRYFIWY